MYMNSEERKQIQAILEDAVSTTSNSEEKKFFFLILSLIYELNEKDQPAPAPAAKSECCGEGGECFLRAIQSIVEGFASGTALENINEECLGHFTIMADNLARLSIKVNELREIMARHYAERTSLKAARVCVVQ